MAPPTKTKLHVARQSPGLQNKNTLSPCRKIFGKARNFAELVTLIREAEAKLGACGITAVEDKVHVLRGLFYGTDWSTDFRSERSEARNAGFQVFTFSSAPPDQRPCLSCGVFSALQASQDAVDGGRHFDLGHAIIGLDARRSSSARHIPLSGGTGLELCTWLGDLGGGAAMLALDRISAPATPATTRMRGSDFGGSINLEGDVAAYVIARDPAIADAPTGLAFPRLGLADAFTTYLGPAVPGAEWNNRAGTFLACSAASSAGLES